MDMSITFFFSECGGFSGSSDWNDPYYFVFHLVADVRPQSFLVERVIPGEWRDDRCIQSFDFHFTS
jgi:hypothetical protein